MPDYTKTWDESKPAGSRAASLGDDDIREFKYAIRERFATDHKAAADETGLTTIGYHVHVTLIDMAGNPTGVTGTGILFSKMVNSKIELHYLDDVGNVTQLTKAGFLIRSSRGLLDYTVAGAVINNSYNVTSVTKNSTGDFTINWTTAFGTAYYFPSVITTGAGALPSIAPGGKLVGSLRVIFRDASGSPADPTGFTVVVVDA